MINMLNIIIVPLHNIKRKQNRQQKPNKSDAIRSVGFDKERMGNDCFETRLS